MLDSGDYFMIYLVLIIEKCGTTLFLNAFCEILGLILEKKRGGVLFAKEYRK